MTDDRNRLPSRRDALTRLGLTAAVAYSAPTVLHLDRAAHAVQPSCTGKGKGKGKGNSWCGPAGKGKGKGRSSSEKERARREREREKARKKAQRERDKRNKSRRASFSGRPSYGGGNRSSRSSKGGPGGRR